MTAKSEPTGHRKHDYHHGDLAEALMDAAVLQIAKEGTENLSLRALARECGVSATAPYRHFPSKRCLFAALATRGFIELKEHCANATREATTLEDQLLSAGQAYIHFAHSNPTVYQLMFGSVLEDFSDYDMLSAAAESAYQVVLDLLERLLADRPELEMDATDLGGVVWAALHGIASLLLFHVVRKGENRPPSPMISLHSLQANPDRALKLLLRGLFP